MRNLKVLFMFSKNALQQASTNRTIFVIFFVSKLIRYGMFLSFLYFLFNGVNSIGGFNRGQMLLFYLVFNVIDTAAQLMFREVYRFRPLIVSGGLDLVLTKPFNPLMRVLFGGPDIIDLGMLAIIIAITAYVANTYFHPNVLEVFLFIFMVINSLVIAAAFHIVVLSLGILTTSVDHLIMIYRDLTSLMRIPVDIFVTPLRLFLTFVIPVGIMFTFPAKVLFGFINWQNILLSFIFGMVSLFVALKSWNFALKGYQSASS